MFVPDEMKFPTQIPDKFTEPNVTVNTETTEIKVSEGLGLKGRPTVFLTCCVYLATYMFCEVTVTLTTTGQL